MGQSVWVLMGIMVFSLHDFGRKHGSQKPLPIGNKFQKQTTFPNNDL
jgi:hypothetical protein